MNTALTLNPPFVLKLNFSFSLKAFWFLLAVLLFFLLIVSVWQLNLYTREVYQIKGYKQSISRLGQENKILEVNFSNSQSLKNVGDYVKARGLERVGSAQYIQLMEETMAAK